MATVSLTRKTRGNASGGRDIIVKWTGLTQTNNDGQWFSDPGAVLRSYSVSGTFGAGGSVAMRASGGDAADPTSPITGSQPDESNIAAALSSAQTVTGSLYTAAPSYRPLVSGGDGTTNLTVTMYFIQD